MTGRPVTRILLANDQDDVRNGFRLVLDAQPGMRVVGRRETASAPTTSPGISDPTWSSPTSVGSHGWAGTDTPSARPGCHRSDQVVVTSTFDLDEHVIEALQAGRVSPSSNAWATLMIEAVRAAVAGTPRSPE